MPPTFKGFDVKLHSAYRPFQILEGEGPVEGVVVAEFPSMEEAKRQVGISGSIAFYCFLGLNRLKCKIHLSQFIDIHRAQATVLVVILPVKN
jgi:hypothetical protein